MKLHLFTWNLQRDDSGGTSLLDLCAAHYKKLGVEVIGWLTELPAGIASTYDTFRIIRPSRKDHDAQHTSGLGAYFISRGVKLVHDPDHAEEVYRRTYSTFFEVGGSLFPCSGFHLYSKQHPTRQDPVVRAMEAKDRIDRMTTQWLSPPSGSKFHPSLFSHICLGDFNEAPDSRALADHLSFGSTADFEKVIRQRTGNTSGKDFVLRFNPAALWNGTPRGSYFFDADQLDGWNCYDQILLCPDAANLYQKDSFRIVDALNGVPLFRSLKRHSGQVIHIPDEKKRSDHFPVELVLEVP